MMSRLYTDILLSIFIVSMLSIVESTPQSYIVGGNEVEPGDYPYFVDIYGCGGALVAPDIVLTAAHCRDKTGQQVLVGAYKRNEITPEDSAVSRFCDEWIPDPLYEGNDGEFFNNYDYALCKLDQPVDIDAASTVNLVLNDDDTVPALNEELTVMGLGWLNTDRDIPDYVNVVNVPAVNSTGCLDVWGDDTFNPDTMICAGYRPENGIGRGKDSCKGDSGGPLVRRTIGADGSVTDVHVGIVSFGIPCAFLPTVYAKTSGRIDWIRDTMCDDLDSIAGFCYDGLDGDNSTIIDDPPASTPEAPCDAATEDTLTVRVLTDNYAGEVSWNLTTTDDDGDGSVLVLTRRYLLNNYQNEHNICLPKNGNVTKCYEWSLYDSYGDGICYTDDPDAPCPPYSLSLNGEIAAAGDGNFESVRQEIVCTNASAEPSSAPSSAPSSPPSSGEVECVDDPDFRWKNKEQTTCRKFIKKRNRKKAEKRCLKEWEDKPVYEWCPKSCGDRAGIGPCAPEEE
mmetsp:Transcript_8789/g.21458  ORF Transcript_8789/g.21458 Transcript_8789/m.21458 type:complete len:509 (-) Transcript_8789:127-1653(-)